MAKSNRKVYALLQYHSHGVWVPVVSTSQLCSLLEDSFGIVSLKEFVKHFHPLTHYVRNCIVFRLIFVDKCNRMCDKTSSYIVVDSDRMTNSELPYSIISNLCFV